MQNEVIEQVINTIRRDILQNKDFLKAILSKVQLTEENIPTETILTMMQNLGAQLQTRLPQSNRPKETTKNMPNPVPMGLNSIASKIVSDLLEGNNVYLMGQAGTGKTFLAKNIAENVLRQPVYTINCSQWTSPIEIRGGQTITGYEEGQLIKAWANGGVLILDELPKLDPNTAGLLNDALAVAAQQPVYDSEGRVIKVPKITNGRGEEIEKGRDQKDPELKFRFCVIATGNTDMMNVGNAYSGNQRQDYSLVDRFAGSYYTLNKDVNLTTERKLCYDFVFNVCNTMRDFLLSKDALQSISLRTMLNFNRTYEQEMLYKIESPYADEIFSNEGNRIPPKQMTDTINSFKSMLDKTLQDGLETYEPFRLALASKTQGVDYFVYEFMTKYLKDPRTGEDVTDAEIASAKAEGQESLK